jgi:hypothetical protein
MICDEIEEARAKGDRKRVATLKMVLKHYVQHHACGA